MNSNAIANYDSNIAQSRKADVARRQLGTALHLWLADLDPVSVHVLACGGCEIAEALAQKIGKPFSAFSREVHHELGDADLKGIRNRLWNAMKHAHDRKGRGRDDEELLSAPLEADNEALLSEGWYDLMQVMPVPIEAHALTMWFLAKHGNRSELHDDLDDWFPDLQLLASADQKELLRSRIREWRQDAELMSDDRTDERPLIIPA